MLVQTSDRALAGTDAQVTLTVFGVNGDSGPLPLGEPDNGFFESGATDQFDVSTALSAFSQIMITPCK